MTFDASPRRAAGFLLCALSPAAALADTLVVPTDFGTIQEAIDEAEDNDTIVVEPGTYTENIELRSGIDVTGRETARTILSPDDDTLPTVTINGVTAARFSNFTLTDSSVGVSITASNAIDVTNVVFDRVSDTGVLADDSSVELANDVFFDNEVAVSRAGVDVEIVSSIFAGNGTAIANVLSLADPFEGVRTSCYFENEESPSDVDGTGGSGAEFGDPQFVDPAALDFHLQEGSACIDIGRGTDAIDGTVADAGAYGGSFADPFPFPVPEPALEAVTGDDPAMPGIEVTWEPNLSHRVTSSTNPGGYRVYYKQGAAPEDNLPEEYDGDDAAAGPSPIDAGDVTSFTLEGVSAEVDAPLAPRLSSAEGRNAAIVVAWEPVEGATGYRVHYGRDDVAENAVDVGDVTSHTITGLENGVTYRVAVSALDQAIYHVAVSVLDNSQARHESVLSPPASIALGEPAESPLSQVLTATPGEIAPTPDLPDEDACFIATAAFGAEWTAEVEALRAFRDRFLLPHAAGRWLVARYYALSPPAARFLDSHAALKPFVRAALLPLVGAALVLLGASPGSAAALLGLAAAWIAARRRSRRAGRAALWLAALSLVAFSASAQEPPSGPRWMYSLKGGFMYPDIDEFETFYGDDRDGVFAVSGGYRFRDWLEAGVGIGYLSERGDGLTPDGARVPDAVKLELLPVHFFAGFALPDPDRRLVPYAEVGAGWTFYREAIELQPDRDGKSELGTFARLGVRWRFASEGRRMPSGEPSIDIFSHSYVFLEAEHVATEADGIELGGTSWLLGVRFELELGPRRDRGERAFGAP
ncbi:MAG TPA: CFI-box-CTERM domain-containing protein [Gammaproteobacteria bacterium]